MKKKVLFSLMGCAILATLFMPVSAARPKGWIIDYYSDSYNTTLVGYRETGTCGFRSWGVVTPYPSYVDACW